MNCINKYAPAPAIAAIAMLVMISSVAGQEDRNRGRNNPYSPSPISSGIAVGSMVSQPTQKPTEPVTSEVKAAISPVPQGKIAFVTTPGVTRPTDNGQAQAEVAQEPVRSMAAMSTTSITGPPPTSVYRIGVGDVITVTLTNAGQKSVYCTVRTDGTIDFPLAGDNIEAAGLSPVELQARLAKTIKLYANPAVDVRVREYNSHRITVLGLVSIPNELTLQREAMPVYAVTAQAGVDRAASVVRITRTATNREERYTLGLAETGDVLVYPGDKVEFLSATISKNRSNH